MPRLTARIATRLAITAACATIALAAPAQANLVTNGDFAGGTLAGWTVFTTTANGTTGSGLPVVSAFDVTGGGAQNAATFNAGQIVFNFGVQEGGGIRQSVTFAGGVATFSASIAAFNPGVNQNTQGGVFTVLLDNVALDTVSVGLIDANTAYRDTLNFAANVSAGAHELEILITRSFRSNLTVPTPYQYITNISLTEETAAIPEPATLALLGAGLIGLAAARRRRA